MAFLFWRLRRCDLELDSNSPCLYTLIRIFLAPAIVVTEALVPETEVKTEAPGVKAKTKTEAVASETKAKTKALVPETEVKTEAPGFKAKTKTEAVASETKANHWTHRNASCFSSSWASCKHFS